MHVFSLNKSVRGDSPTYSSGANYLATGQELLDRSLRPVRSTPHAELYAGQEKGKDVTENSKKQLRQRKFVQQEA